MRIILNDESFRYDVHSLVKAFYPQEELNFDIISKEIAGNEPEIFFDGDLFVYIPKDLAKDRFLAKNQFKRKIYGILSKESEKDLPWGTLTGIRPVKIPAKQLSLGKNPKEILSYMKDTYLISDKKADLALDIALREERLLKGIDLEKTASLYVGIPFCPSICAYCSFSSYPLNVYRDHVEAYLKALYEELEFVANNLKKRIVSIYIGGGTPSTLEPSQLKELCEFINLKFNLSYLREFSVECGRPDSITVEKLKALKDSGVGRISINPQTMHDKTLRLIGRAHKASDIYRAFDMARSVGISCINTDLIVGLPKENEEEIKYTLNEICSLNPENITVHSLAIKRASKLNLEWEDSDYGNISEDIMDFYYDRAKANALFPYYLYRQKQIAGNFENVGFAKSGLECLYNVLIMGEYQDIIACGAGGVSKFLTGKEKKPERVTNIKDVFSYIERIDEMKERKIKWL